MDQSRLLAPQGQLR